MTRNVRSQRCRSWPDTVTLDEPGLQVIADPESVGDDGQCGVHRRAGREEAAIHHIEIVDLVSPAVHVQRGGLRVTPEADGSVLVRDAGQRDALTEEKVPREQALM